MITYDVNFLHPEKMVFTCNTDEEKEFIDNNINELTDEFIRIRSLNAFNSFKEWREAEDLFFKRAWAEQWEPWEIKTEWKKLERKTENLKWTRSLTDAFEKFVNYRYKERQRAKETVRRYKILGML